MKGDRMVGKKTGGKQRIRWIPRMKHSMIKIQKMKEKNRNCNPNRMQTVRDPLTPAVGTAGVSGSLTVTVATVA